VTAPASSYNDIDSSLAVIRLRLREQGLKLPHLVVGATPDNQIVLRSNGDPEVVRSFGEAT
jgi:hypothetical protein